MTSLIDQTTKISVSSVLNRDSKQFGKKYLTDNCVDTAWNSDQGASQWILIKFNKIVNLRTIKIQFQGGFAATEVQLICSNQNDNKEVLTEEFNLEDSNKEQQIKLNQSVNCDQLKIYLNNLSDDFGRVIIYKLDVLSD